MTSAVRFLVVSVVLAVHVGLVLAALAVLAVVFAGVFL